MAIGGLLGFQAAMPPWGLALGLAVAATGVWLIRHDLTTRRDQTHPVTKPAAVAHR